MVLNDEVILQDLSTYPQTNNPLQPSRIRRRNVSKRSIILNEQYGDFTTIDWMKDWIRDSERDSSSTILQKILKGIETWFLVAIVGAAIGVLASWLDIVTAYLSDFRRGICKSDWFLSKDICCKGLLRNGMYCEDYEQWSKYLFGSNVYMIDFVIYIASACLLSASSCLLVLRLTRYGSGSGLAEIKTILGGFEIKNFFGLKTLIVKATSLCLAISSGLSIGKEAVMMHLACCVGYNLIYLSERYKQSQVLTRHMISTSVAAGVTVAFASPIGGVLLALEEMSTFFPEEVMLHSFVCALIASATLQLIDPYRGKLVLYQVTYTRPWYFFEIIFFVLIGLLGGLMGSLFLRCNRFVVSYRKRNRFINQNPIWEVTSLSLLTAIVSYFTIYTRVDGTELLEALFRECSENEHLGLCSTSNIGSLLFALLWATVVKLSLSIVTIGSRIPAGTFVPALVWGALIGRIVGEIVQYLHLSFPWFVLFSSCPPEQSCVTPGMYSLLGAMSSLGGITKLTVSLTVIMFELTGTLNYIVPCMVTLATSKVVSDYFEKFGYIEEIISRKNLPFLDPRLENPLFGTVGDQMIPLNDLTVLKSRNETIGSIDHILADSNFQGFPIVSSEEDSSLIGYISRFDLETCIEKFKESDIYNINSKVLFGENEGISTNYLDISHAVDQTPLSVDPSVDMDFVLDFFKKMGARYVVVKKMGRLLGILTKKDLLKLLQTYNDLDEDICDQNEETSSLERHDGFLETQFERTWTIEEERGLLL